MKFLLILSLALSGFTAAQTLTISVENVKSTKGFLYVSLHNSDSTWMKQGILSQKLSMTENSVKVTFNDIPAGDYAVTLYQDENNNGMIDKNAMGIPTEPYGFSKNGGNFGPPSFDDAKIAVSKDESITIYLQ